MRKNRLKNNSGKRQRVNKSMEEPTNRETTSKPKIIRRRVAFYAKKEELSESKGMGDLQANMVLEKAFGIRVKEQETEKFERYEEEKKLRKTLYKFVNNPEAKQMAREHFAMLAQVKEWQITESITLSKTDFTDYFSSMGFHSTLTENIAEYIVKAVPKLSFKGYYKFLAEGLISTCPYVQKQICYSVYSNCKERLYLSEVYSYFDDTLWRFILDDLLLIYEKLNKSETGELQSRVRSRSEIQRELFAKLNFQSKNQRKRQQENSFLLIDSPTSESVIQFRENVASEEEVKAIIGQKDPYLTFEEFSKISFTEKAPTLLFFMMHLLCGEDLADYYAETVRIKAFRYTLINRNGKKDHLVERKATNHIENSIRRENKELVKKVQKAKPTASQGVINFSIKLFQNLRITEHRTFDPHSSGILKESFVENSNLIFGKKVKGFAEQLFDILDSNHKGTVNFMSLFEFVLSLTKKPNNALNMTFFKLYDWNKDGMITESDIEAVIETGEHTLTKELMDETTLIKEVLAKKRISFKNLKKKIYLSVQAFNRLTNGVSAFYQILKLSINRSS